MRFHFMRHCCIPAQMTASCLSIGVTSACRSFGSSAAPACRTARSLTHSVATVGPPGSRTERPARWRPRSSQQTHVCCCCSFFSFFCFSFISFLKCLRSATNGFVGGGLSCGRGCIPLQRWFPNWRIFEANLPATFAMIPGSLSVSRWRCYGPGGFGHCRSTTGTDLLAYPISNSSKS